MHLSALLYDALSANIKHRSETAHWIAQPLFLHPLARGYAEVKLAPQPGHAYLVIVVAELAAQHRFPDDAVGGIAHIAARPFGGGYILKPAPVAGFLQHKSPQAQPDALRQRQGRKAQQIQRRGKVPDASVVKQAHFGFQPCQGIAQPQLLNQFNHSGIADEQMMVAAFQRRAANLKSGRLSAQKGGRLKDRGVMPLLGQFVGCGQAGRAAADNPDAHRASHPVRAE